MKLSIVQVSQVSINMTESLLASRPMQSFLIFIIAVLFKHVSMLVLGALMAIGLQLLQLLYQILIFCEDELIELSDLLQL
jgi:hypothetical protein